MLKFNHNDYNIKTIVLLLSGLSLGLSFSILNLDIKILITINTFLILLSLSLSIAFSDIKLNNPIVMKLLNINQNKTLRYLKFSMVNSENLDGEDLFKAIYKTLFENTEFLEFGFNKIIILSVTLESEQENNLHCNVLVNNDTTFEQYYESVSKDLTKYQTLKYGYNDEEIIRFNMLVWNVDHLKNKKIKQTINGLEAQDRLNKRLSDLIATDKGHNEVFGNQKRSFSSSCIVHDPNLTTTNGKKWFKGLINPISVLNIKGELKQKSVKPIFTMDLETISINGIEVPVAISSCGWHNELLVNKIFLIDHILVQTNQELAVKQLWSKYFSYLEDVVNTEITIVDKLTIFAHNLGGFDGYFLYKGLLNHYSPEHISSLIDDTNTFISIKNNGVPLIEWKDSLRIFPISLDKLCKMFLVEGKVMPYSKHFNNIDLFNHKQILESFIAYSKQDAKALYEALNAAQFIFFDKFKVDIETVYSTATLALKVYRTHFQKESIYILPASKDYFIRKGYFGGGTDVYKAYGKKLYYYDVNSLYPYAMLNPMPHEILNNGERIDLSDRSLDSFFGFAYVRVFCPFSMERPVLPFHEGGKTIYPVGSWAGTYFSEELKAVQKLGYQITLIRGYEFSKIDLFSGYIHHFHEIKKNSTGTEREMAKLQLNNLYGYFGRKQIGLMTVNVKSDQLELLFATRIVKSIIEINDDYTTVLCYSNVNQKMLEELNIEFTNIGSDSHYIMSNVAIAAAVTSYARITMIPFKINPHTLYTDTDSCFTSEPLDPSLIGPELGMMKDELKGQVIEEAYFIGPKKYGYYIIDSETGIRKEFSVFSGVPRNSLSFSEVKSIFEGSIITKNIANRFYKSFTNLNISVKNTKITVKNTNDKLLINNTYLPPKLHLPISKHC